MNALSLNELTASEAVPLLARREISSESLVRASLDRIALRDHEIKAFASVNPRLALAHANTLDASPAVGLLHGIPIGIKDVFDTVDFPTGMGSPIYKEYRPCADASVVSLLRAAGAIVIGKTVTAEFAGMAPTETCNPHDVTRTPGGSSSGSAAAVADLMVPIALGTQTGGSVQRPASYCGVFGFKPTFGRINRAGMKFAAESLDTVGWISRSIDDLALVDAALTGADRESNPKWVPSRIGICHTHLWSRAQAETRDALEHVAQRLRDTGVQVIEIEWLEEFSRLSEAREIINDYERARALAHEWSTQRKKISDPLSRSISRGYGISHQDYLAALRFSESMRLKFDVILSDYDVLLAPCVNGEAPSGLGYAGDPAFQAIWTLLHTPTLGMPTHRAPSGMPVSIQLVAGRYREGALFRAAQAIWDIVQATAKPDNALFRNPA